MARLASAVLITLAALLTLAGCSSTAPGQPAPTSTAASTMADVHAQHLQAFQNALNAQGIDVNDTVAGAWADAVCEAGGSVNDGTLALLHLTLSGASIPGPPAAEAQDVAQFAQQDYCPTN